MTLIFPIVTDNQKAVLGVAITFTILAVTAVCLRLLAHHIARKRWTPSDYFIITACTFAVGLESITITGVVQAGIGYGHTMSIVEAYGEEPITKLLQLIIPLQFTWVLSLSCTKISILCLYLQIFPVTWVVGSCGNQVTSFTATGVINLLTDVAVLLIPMPLLYRLQMPTYKKVALIAVFGLGIITCIVSIMRIAALSTMSFTDITYSLPRANIFSGVEPCLAVVTASIPLMRPLLGRSVYTPESSTRPSKLSGSFPRAGLTAGNGSQPMDDETSQLWMRPIGTNPEVDIEIQKSDSLGDLSVRSEETVGSSQSRRRLE
ncbi:hypothetical protein N7507_007019 [Penicillium longicatenatum]|nr:hypothetical protein N7507_007019 [Penicillium longicatenatum]